MNSHINKTPALGFSKYSKFSSYQSNTKIITYLVKRNTNCGKAVIIFVLRVWDKKKHLFKNNGFLMKIWDFLTKSFFSIFSLIRKKI